MKIRNKNTGETGYLLLINWNEPELIVMDENGVQLGKYSSLVEFNKEWKDYEEPKEHYFISDLGEVQKEGKSYINDITPEKLEKIGNYFESKEEAEKAVEKLKAWKRMKETKMHFNDYHYELKNIDALALVTYKLEIEVDGFAYEGLEEDLELLFGGEE